MLDWTVQGAFKPNPPPIHPSQRGVRTKINLSRIKTNRFKMRPTFQASNIQTSNSFTKPVVVGQPERVSVGILI